MHVTRIKEDISAINCELFRRKGLAVKFRVKTYYETQDNQYEYYHKEYVFNSGNKRMGTMSIVPKSYLQFDIIENNTKELFFMSEAMKNKVVRKLNKMITLLEAYEDNEIDIVAVDASGTHIKNGFPKSEKIIMGRSKVTVLVCIREEKCDVGVAIKFDDYNPIIIGLPDFFELYYKLKELNYTSTALALLNYLGCPELGVHETDFRQIGVLDVGYGEISTPETYSDPMKDFSGIKDSQTRLVNKKVNW